MKRIRYLIGKHPVVTFYTTTLLAFVIIGIINRLLFPSSTYYLLMFVQWSPAIAAILLVSLVEGKSGIRNILQKTLFKTVYLKWYLIALLIPVIVCGLSYIGLTFIENKAWVMPEFGRSVWNYAICFMAALFGSYGEEIGWRGYMLPKLQKKHSFFVSSLIIGFFWGLWHLKFQSGISVFFIYIFLVIEFSLIISWLYEMTKGNIMSAILFHTSVNVCSLIFFEKVIVDATNQRMLLLLYGLYAIIFLIPCMFIIKRMLTHQYIDNKKHKLNGVKID